MIGYKIGTGKLTLIVAFDQTTSGKSTKDIASALQKFLELYPQVRCICTGRPHAIVDQCWEPLFQHDTWEFVQVEASSKEHAETIVGADRWKLCQCWTTQSWLSPDRWKPSATSSRLRNSKTSARPASYTGEASFTRWIKLGTRRAQTCFACRVNGR